MSLLAPLKPPQTQPGAPPPWGPFQSGPRSAIYTGRVMHSRLEPVSHAFEYPAYLYALDMDELPKLAESLRLFSLDRFNIASLRQTDYLRGSGRLRDEVTALARQHGLEAARVQLFTSARYFGYTFNPVSFYYTYDLKDQLSMILAEVNNTFGERHLYALPKPEWRDGFWRARLSKDFHVSPFFGVEGDYEFLFSPAGPQWEARINIHQQERVVFRSRIAGRATPLSDLTLLKTLARFPASATLTMPRILWQAAKLRYQKRLPVYTKPYAQSAMTLRAEAPSRWQRWLRERVLPCWAAPGGAASA